MAAYRPDLPENRGIKRPYLNLPDTLEGEQSFCITIPAGLSNKLALIDLLGMATWWYNWQRSPGTDAKQTADAWRDKLNLPELEECMSCCPEPTNRRYNEDGILEVSYDGGDTWTPAPELDDRFSGTIAPPLSGTDGSEKACIAAASAEEYVKQNLIESLETGATFAEINTVGVAIVALLGVTGIGLLIAGLAAAIFVAGVAAVQAAFTAEVWTDFRCLMYCRIEADGSFTVAGWQGVKNDILTHFTGIVSAVLYNWVNSVGVVGLTNAARSGFAASADCSACDECLDSECGDPETVTIGTVTDSFIDGDGYHTLLVDSAPFMSENTVAIGTYGEGAPPGKCCRIHDFVINTGDYPFNIATTKCDGTVNDPGDAAGYNTAAVSWNSHTPFSITIRYF